MCALVVAAWLAGQPAAAADDDSRPLQLEVFINDTPTDRIGTFALLADQKLAATRGELAELGVNAPGTGAAEDAIVIDAASGIEYRYDEPASEPISSWATSAGASTVCARERRRAVQPKPDFGAVMNYTLFGGVTNRSARFPDSQAQTHRSTLACLAPTAHDPDRHRRLHDVARHGRAPA